MNWLRGTPDPGPEGVVVHRHPHPGEVARAAALAPSWAGLRWRSPETTVGTVVEGPFRGFDDVRLTGQPETTVGPVVDGPRWRVERSVGINRAVVRHGSGSERYPVGALGG
jgi:hypothetical protein